MKDFFQSSLDQEPSKLTYGSVILDTRSCVATYDGCEVTLNPKEYALLKLFLSYPNHVLSYDAIIDGVWEGDNIPTYSSIRTHIKRLRQAFKAAQYPNEIVENVHSLGYRLKPLPTAEATIIRPSQAVLQRFFQVKSIEYLVVNDRQVILYQSPGVSQYSDYPHELKVGNSVNDSFPELLGLETVFAEILAQKREGFDLKGIARAQNPQRPEYINLYAIADKQNTSAQHIFIFCEDASEHMQYRQRLVQHANETMLLLERLRT
ncbi:MAG: response regulator transcription factor [Cyanobacteria bacterium J06638_28]